MPPPVAGREERHFDPLEVGDPGLPVTVDQLVGGDVGAEVNAVARELVGGQRRGARDQFAGLALASAALAGSVLDGST